MTLAHPALLHDGLQTVWSGNLWAHGHCDEKFENCKSALCPADGCAVNRGPQGPTTLAEFTLLNNGQDTYDVSVINGINLPVSMYPSPDGAETPVFPPGGAAASYWCGAPGSPDAHGVLLAASWDVAEHAAAETRPFYRYVSSLETGSDAGADSGAQGTCEADASACPVGLSCGLHLDTNASPETQWRCGALIGWWSADELCSVNSGEGFSFLDVDCQGRLPIPPQYQDAGAYADQPRQMDVLLCQQNPQHVDAGGTFDNSCYTEGAEDAACCGCQNWPGLAATGQCLASNTSWTELALPWVTPLKRAVPTAYSYPYDDKTSTFNCYSVSTDAGAPAEDGTPAQRANSTAYTIEFCPGGTEIQ